MSRGTITVNGRLYDVATGAQVGASGSTHVQKTAGHNAQPARAFTDIAARSDAKPLHKERPAHEVHAAAQKVHKVTQKSQTLHRQALKKPIIAIAEQAKPAHARSPHISRFNAPQVAPQSVEPDLPQSPPPDPNEPPVMHPAVARALQQHSAQQAAAQAPNLTSKELKDQLIKERLAEVGNSPTKKEKKAHWLSRQPRLVTILSSTLALLILGGYLTYITLPSISLKVAASRAGLNASMPEYKPDGYSLDGPITYSPGEVVISYKSNTNDSGYKLVQKATNWDSRAVLDNYVGKLTDNYLTFQERGVTVYTFGNKAAWVNGGLLYTIDGNAALSSDQILRLATSL